MTYVTLNVPCMPGMPCLSSQARFIMRPQLLTRL
jgi:hypothetical protein